MLEPQIQKPTTLEDVHSRLKLVSEIVTAVVIITTVTSVVIGTMVINLYLSNFSISISPLDTLSASSLQIFMVFFVTLMVGAVSLFLIPFAAPYYVDPETRHSLPNLFGRRYSPPDALRPGIIVAPQRRRAFPLTIGTVPSFSAEYGMFYLPTLAFIWIIPFAAYFDCRSRRYTIGQFLCQL